MLAYERKLQLSALAAEVQHAQPPEPRRAQQQGFPGQYLKPRPYVHVYLTVNRDGLCPLYTETGMYSLPI
jgi:hypothetical protein